MEHLDDNEQDSTDEAEEIDWYFEQKLDDSTEDTVRVTSGPTEYGYGFNSSKTGVFQNLLAEFELLLDVKSPDSKTQG